MDYAYPKPYRHEVKSKLPVDIQLTRNLQLDDITPAPIRHITIPVPVLDLQYPLQLPSKEQQQPPQQLEQEYPAELLPPKAQDLAKQENTFDVSDHLACHADNILRMAVDSTMLGSTIEYTFNDSINEKTPGLMLSKATKVEINADELIAAVNGEL
ncbi:hypothetical protein JA1_001997 [Spathaspora sp. JA1]|nr:hypothetical protein JA1_001997 [Spathaspora sp. JA1]